MAKIAVLKIDEKTGAVKALGTTFNNDAEATASIKAKGIYALVEVHTLEPVKKVKGNE